MRAAKQGMKRVAQSENEIEEWDRPIGKSAVTLQNLEKQIKEVE
ncbi:MAG: hypothetical protein OXI36_08980 [Gammaproteobacteria bacterium]|nr:hypothetical protein [Gammaproteobacteria bacterium]